jgi:hypothetical protein
MSEVRYVKLYENYVKVNGKKKGKWEWNKMISVKRKIRCMWMKKNELDKEMWKK